MGMRWIVGILMAVFLLPVCIMAGAFGGCIMGAMASGAGGSDAAMTVGIVSGCGVGLLAGIALTVLVVRSIRATPTAYYDPRYPPPPPPPPYGPYPPAQ
jgi:hypothetical protein